jgi:DNA-binding NarL/FixJ family response regulator
MGHIPIDVLEDGSTQGEVERVVPEREWSSQIGHEHALAQIGAQRVCQTTRVSVGGLPPRDVAARRLAAGTVKVHMHNIYEKLDVIGRIELTNYARENGLL